MKKSGNKIEVGILRYFNLVGDCVSFDESMEDYFIESRKWFLVE